MLRNVIKWEPQISLEQGLVGTYQWIEQQVKATQGAATAAA
jgi:nucleoside-diphosphate-sugar epimerase